MIGSMCSQLTGLGKQIQPHAETFFRYVPNMERPDPKRVLRDNVLALMRQRYGRQNKHRFKTEAGVGIATVDRILGAQTSIGLDTLEQIAERFDLLPWQLLVPGFDPAHKPVLAHAGLSEQQWYRMLQAAETVAEYSRKLSGEPVR